MKIKMEGTPEEIAAFLARVSNTDGITVTMSTGITKRGENHKWGSALAWLDVDPVQGTIAEYGIYQRANKKAGKGQRQAIRGYVYLVPAYGEGGIIGYKIGKTTNPESRRKTFGVKFNFDVGFLALIASADYSLTETKLHQQFAAKRRGNSEWFDLDADDIEFIKGMMTPAEEKLLKKLNRQK
jgi:hypothetical protein